MTIMLRTVNKVDNNDNNAVDNGMTMVILMTITMTMILRILLKLLTITSNTVITSWYHNYDEDDDHDTVCMHARFLLKTLYRLHRLQQCILTKA